MRRDAGTNVTVPFVLLMLAELYAIARQPEEGLGWLAEA
jgi:hypothetical protein